MISYILVCVPVQARLFEDKPVFPPFLGEIAFSILLLPQPALTVTVSQVLTGNSPAAGASEGPCGDEGRRGIDSQQKESCPLGFKHLVLRKKPYAIIANIEKRNGSTFTSPFGFCS